MSRGPRLLFPEPRFSKLGLNVSGLFLSSPASRRPPMVRNPTCSTAPAAKIFAPLPQNTPRCSGWASAQLASAPNPLRSGGLQAGVPVAASSSRHLALCDVAAAFLLALSLEGKRAPRPFTAPPDATKKQRSLAAQFKRPLRETQVSATVAHFHSAVIARLTRDCNRLAHFRGIHLSVTALIRH
jgi:hypothetical protein